MNKIRCYGVNEILKMRGIKDSQLEELAETFIEYDVHVFQPPTTPGSGRGRRAIGYYVTTNENFDRWVQLNNTCALIKNLPNVKIKYKIYPYQREVDIFGYLV